MNTRDFRAAGRKQGGGRRRGEGWREGAGHLADVVRPWQVALHERVASVPLACAARKAHGEFGRSDRDAVCDHAGHKLAFAFRTRILSLFIPLIRAPSLSLPCSRNTRTHTHIQMHALTYARHGRERTGVGGSRHFYGSAAMRTAADRGPSSPRDDDRRRHTQQTRTPPRAGLPRLFKFPLTVRSARRRTPAVAHAAPNVARNTSALLVREPTTRSHALGVYFSRDTTSPIRTSYHRLGETAKMAGAVT